MHSFFISQNRALAFHLQKVKVIQMMIAIGETFMVSFFKQLKLENIFEENNTSLPKQKILQPW